MRKTRESFSPSPLPALPQILHLPQARPKLIDIREIPQRQAIPSSTRHKLSGQGLEQFGLFLTFPKHGRDLLSEIVDQIRVDLDGPRAFHQFVDSSHHGIVW